MARREHFPLHAWYITLLAVAQTAQAYVLVPAITLTTDLFEIELSSGAVGNVVSSQWEGMKHHEIARLRSLFHQVEDALAIWEIDDFDRLDIVSRAGLWRAFEQFLLRHYPQAIHVFGDNSEPGDNDEGNPDFLRSVGYQRVAVTLRINAKSFGGRQQGATER